MKKLILIVATVFIVFVVGSMIAFLVLPPAFVELHGNSQRVPTDFDYGSWVGSTYKNDFFGFSITIPENWYILEKEERKASMKAGAEELKNANIFDKDEMERVTKITEITTANLFHVGYPAEEAMEEESNRNLILSVEKVPEKINRAQYVKITRQNFTKLSPNLVIKSETNKTIATQEFASLEIEFEVYGIPVYQEHLICLKNGFAVFFVLTWLENSDKEQLDAIMATLVWE
jgi:hypothetical protein